MVWVPLVKAPPPPLTMYWIVRPPSTATVWRW
jgi:hypothetical protein